MWLKEPNGRDWSNSEGGLVMTCLKVGAWIQHTELQASHGGGVRQFCSMASVTLANRELKNRATGIDIYVPQHEDVQGPLGGSVVYNVIVVTRLFYFKMPGKHKESDVVQFMIRQKYGNFEELYHKLEQKFPSVVFPQLPKRALLVSDAVVAERRRIMESVLQQIARTPKLACSSLVLEFLGARGPGKTELEPQEEDTTRRGVQEVSKEDKEEEEIDLFATSGDKKQNQEDEETEDNLLSSTSKVQIAPTTTAGSSLFGLDDDDDGKDEDIDGLFIPKDAVIEKKVHVKVEDHSELLNIEDDLDELLKVSKPKKPEKPQKPAKPTRLKPKPDLKPKPSPKPTFEEASAGDDLFKASSTKPKLPKKPVAERGKGQGEDLFEQARKQTPRKPSHEEDTLDDIFKSSPKQLFDSAEGDEDLFKTAESSTMTADDISSYIQQNTTDSSSNLDLF